MWLYLALLVWLHWQRGLVVAGVIVSYWLWRRRRPADLLRISDAEVVLNAGLLRRFQIRNQWVQEVSVASQGVIIAWKKAGVPHYTYVKAAWFEEEVWRKTCPALLAWSAGSAQTL